MNDQALIPNEAHNNQAFARYSPLNITHWSLGFGPPTGGLIGVWSLALPAEAFGEGWVIGILSANWRRHLVFALPAVALCEGWVLEALTEN